VLSRALRFKGAGVARANRRATLAAGELVKVVVEGLRREAKSAALQYPRSTRGRRRSVSPSAPAVDDVRVVYAGVLVCEHSWIGGS
jgi:hypothetical protein